MKRTPLTRKTGIRPVSPKRKAHAVSGDGKAGREHMARVAQLPCVICGAWPVHVHHVIHGRYGTRKASDFDVVPLCPSHHLDGPEAIHSGKLTWAAKHGPDYSYLPAVRDAVKG